MKFTSAKQTQEAAKAAVPPFKRVHGQPTQKHFKTWRGQAFDFLISVDRPGTEFGLIGELADDDQFQRITGEDEYRQREKPAAYNPEITDDMDEEERRRLTAEWVDVQQQWYVEEGSLKGLCDQFQKAMDEK